MPENEVEERLSSLERQVRQLTAQIQSTQESNGTSSKDWRKSVGMFRGRTVMKEIDAEGDQIRREDREQAAHGHS